MLLLELLKEEEEEVKDTTVLDNDIADIQVDESQVADIQVADIDHIAYMVARTLCCVSHK